MRNLTNQLPADELHALREQRRAIEEREKELCGLLIDDPSARTGNSYVAVIKEYKTTRIAHDTLRQLYPEAAEASTFTTTQTRVELHGIDQETGEIVSPRKFKAMLKDTANGH